MRTLILIRWAAMTTRPMRTAPPPPPPGGSLLIRGFHSFSNPARITTTTTKTANLTSSSSSSPSHSHNLRLLRNNNNNNNHNINNNNADVRRLVTSTTRSATAGAAVKEDAALTGGSLDAVRARRCAIFDAEGERQREAASKRLKKIKIVCEEGGSELFEQQSSKVELWMNKDLSTPRDCALHLNTLLVKRR